MKIINYQIIVAFWLNYIQSNWWNFGTNINIDVSTLENFGMKHIDLIEVFTYWNIDLKSAPLHQ